MPEGLGDKFAERNSWESLRSPIAVKGGDSSARLKMSKVCLIFLEGELAWPLTDSVASLTTSCVFWVFTA